MKNANVLFRPNGRAVRLLTRICAPFHTEPECVLMFVHLAGFSDLSFLNDFIS